MATGNALARGVYVVAAKRTAFGTFGGSLKAHTPTDLQVLSSSFPRRKRGSYINKHAYKR